MFKKLSLALSLIFIFSFSLLAQSSAPIDLEVEKFAVEYSLDQEQKTQVNDVAKKQFNAIKKVIENRVLSPLEARQQIEELKKDRVNELQKILSKEQYAKFKENNSKNRSK